MNFNLRKPCKGCPFRKDVRPFLKQERAKEIAVSVALHDQAFPCHKTLGFDDETENTVTTPKSEHCAGALLMLEKMDRPNQFMRIAERTGIYKRSRLDMKTPVFESIEEMIEHFE
ncbi:MAG: DUF6283 family protein [Pseudomonadota bacterium]|nr:DUF6283 family protein [Pseudomonadota bacterium]